VNASAIAAPMAMINAFVAVEDVIFIQTFLNDSVRTGSPQAKNLCILAFKLKGGRAAISHFNGF